MAAELFVPPSRALDPNADPYSGAKAFFYATGTTTPQSVYTTSALSVAHANPVVADSGGKFASIYFDSSLTYRVVIKNSAESVTLHDIDPVNTGTLTALAASGGSALVSFLQAGTGALSRTVQSKLRDTVDAFDFIASAKHAGILAGSNTDDLSAELQAALDTGKIVRLPAAGTMWIASSLEIPSNSGFVGNFGCTIKAKANFGDSPLLRNATADPATAGARDTNITLIGVKLDGNKANNSTGTEFSHGVMLNAVDGVRLDVWAKNCKGDGVLFNYAYAIGGGSYHYEVGCRDMRGIIRTETCARQGTSITCGEAFDLSVFDYQGDLLAFDIEPDQTTNYVRDGEVRVFAIESGQAASGLGGAVLVNGTNYNATGRADVRNVLVNVYAVGCESASSGGGIVWRDVRDVTFRGFVKSQTGNAIVGLDANFAASRVHLDVTIESSSGRGLTARGAGDIIDGELRIQTTGDIACYIEGADGGNLKIRARGVTGQGVDLKNTDDMIVTADVDGCSGAGVLVEGTSSGNRFPDLRSTNSTFGYGFQETNTANNNRATNARISGNGGGSVTLVGSTSIVERETIFAKATYDPGSLATDAETAIQSITVTGAALGDEARVTFSNDLAGIDLPAWVSAADTVKYYFSNRNGANPLDLASGTVRAYVTPRHIA